MGHCQPQWVSAITNANDTIMPHTLQLYRTCQSKHLKMLHHRFLLKDDVKKKSCTFLIGSLLTEGHNLWSLCQILGKEQLLHLLIHLKLCRNVLVPVIAIWCTLTWFKSFEYFGVIETMMQCSCFSAQCELVAWIQGTVWSPPLHQCYPIWWKRNDKKDKVILPGKLSHSINIWKQLPSVQLHMGSS